MIMINTEKKLESIMRYERFYSEDYIKGFSELYQEKRKKAENQPFFQAYYNIIDKVSELLQKLPINDLYTLSVVYEYLLWNGYFSKNHHLIYSMEKRINHLALTGADVMRGKSVCLNNANMLSDILRNLGYNSYCFCCSLKLSKDNKEQLYRPNIERQIVHPSILYKTLTSIIGKTLMTKLGNHAITIVEKDRELTMVDPTSLLFLKNIDYLKACYIGSNIEVRLKPLLSLALNDFNKEKLDSIVYSTVIPRSNTPSIEDIQSLSEEALKLCAAEETRLSSFHDDISNDIDIVCKTLKR